MLFVNMCVLSIRPNELCVGYKQNTLYILNNMLGNNSIFQPHTASAFVIMVARLPTFYISFVVVNLNNS